MNELSSEWMDEWIDCNKNINKIGKYVQNKYRATSSGLINDAINSVR